jgi:hypothetical protein
MASRWALYGRRIAFLVQFGCFVHLFNEYVAEISAVSTFHCVYVQQLTYFNKVCRSIHVTNAQHIWRHYRY